MTALDAHTHDVAMTPEELDALEARIRISVAIHKTTGNGDMQRVKDAEAAADAIRSLRAELTEMRLRATMERDDDAIPAPDA